MLHLWLLLAADATAPTIKAERDYSALAQTAGQWTAFRATAADDSLMFVPEPVAARAWLKDRPDPAISVIWWPGRVWMSCDGKLGINYGPWLRKGGRTGTFTTVWEKTSDGAWKWKLDRGSTTPRAVGAGDAPKVTRASCAHLDHASDPAPDAAPDVDPLFVMEGQMPSSQLAAMPAQGEIIRSGRSPDKSLRWEVRKGAGESTGSHILRAWRWDGARYRLFALQVS